jgi:hypothetical protein
MKKTFVKIVSKKFIAALVIVSAMLAFTPAQSMAKSRQDIEILSTENATTVQFAGSAVNALLFDVKINNAEGQKFTLVIRNAEGEVLFNKDYTDKSFSKKIKILKDESSGTRFSFNITSANKELENSFEVNATTKVVDDVTITKN